MLSVSIVIISFVSLEILFIYQNYKPQEKKDYLTYKMEKTTIYVKKSHYLQTHSFSVQYLTLSCAVQK